MTTRILNVDDSLPGRFAKSTLLRRAGYDVEEAGSGEEALERVLADPPAIVLLDVRLPGIDGIEVARRIKTNPALRNVLILQVSATFTGDDHKTASLEAGADAFLPEPYHAPLLLATVRALVRLRDAEVAQAELALREQAARREAETANRVKDQFLATLSHELRTPLNAILGWTHLLRSGRLDPGATGHALEVIERNARAQGQLIDDLLDISRIVSGRLRIARSPVNVGAMVSAAAETIKPAAAAREVEIVLNVEAGLPHVEGDQDRLQQVMLNLLSNAVKFTPAGGRVEIRGCTVQEGVEVQVHDTGQGISPEFLPFVFEAFRQADSSASRSRAGLGLGLAIARSVVGLHGGTIRAESEGEGRGATFTVVLPLRIPMLLGSTQRRGDWLPTTPDRQDALEGAKVLLVEDDEDASAWLVTALSSFGADVVPVHDAATAFTALQTAPPHLIVCDIGMPGEDGYSLMRRIRALPPHEGGSVPAIALTAYATDDDRLRAEAAGFTIHLAKPIDPGLLVGSVARILGRESPSA